MLRSLRTVLAIAASALLLAACGDDGMSKNEYVERNNEIQTEAMKAVNDLSSSSDPEKFASGIADVKTSLDTAIEDLKALDPPADWTDEHADLVKAIEGMRSTLDDLKTAAEKEDPTALTDAVGELTKQQEAATKAINAMNADR